MGYDTAIGPTLWTPPDTTAPEVDERIHWRLISELLESQVGQGRVFDYGTVTGSIGNQADEALPDIYVLAMIERRYVGPRRAGRSGRSGWRITVRYVGTTPDEARWAGLRATGALDEVRLLVGEHWSTPLSVESSTGIEYDTGRWSGMTLWTYVL